MALVLGLPKGSLQESTFQLMRNAGFDISVGSRSYVPRVDDPDLACRLIRPQEISRYVELGLLDVGITGYDWIYENGSDVEEVAELCYSKATSHPVRWVIAVPNDSPYQTVKDLEGKRIATEAVGAEVLTIAAPGEEPLVSPVIDGGKVTFLYENDTATKVEVFGVNFHPGDSKNKMLQRIYLYEFYMPNVQSVF